MSNAHRSRSAYRAVHARAFKALPAIDRDVLLLHDVEGLSYTELGQVLGVTVAAARARVGDARRRVAQVRLRGELGDDGLELVAPARSSSE